MTGNALTSLVYFLGFGVLFYWMMRKGGCGMHAHGHGGHTADHAGGLGHADPPSRAARDPVCGMDVDPAHAAGTRSVTGRTFYLCSAACLTKFDRDPEGYAKRASTVGTPPGQEQLQHRGS